MASYTDDESAQKTALALAWAQHFRVPREWWEGDPIRTSVARATRERVQREMPVIVRRVRELRAAGRVAESDALLEQTIAYVRRVQTLFPRLLNGASPSLVQSMSDGIRDLMTRAENAAIDAGEGVTDVARNVTSGLSGGAVGLAVLVGIYLWSEARRKAR